MPECLTPGCHAPVIRKSHRGRPPRFCPQCQTGAVAKRRSRSGTAHKPAPWVGEIPANPPSETELLMDAALVPESFNGAPGGYRVSMTREGLRKPVDITRESARGPATIGGDRWIPGGSDEYYERKRAMGLIADPRHVK